MSPYESSIDGTLSDRIYKNNIIMTKKLYFSNGLANFIFIAHRDHIGIWNVNQTTVR